MLKMFNVICDYFDNKENSKKQKSQFIKIIINMITINDITTEDKNGKTILYRLCKNRMGNSLILLIKKLNLNIEHCSSDMERKYLTNINAFNIQPLVLTKRKKQSNLCSEQSLKLIKTFEGKELKVRIRNVPNRKKSIILKDSLCQICGNMKHYGNCSIKCLKCCWTNTKIVTIAQAISKETSKVIWQKHIIKWKVTVKMQKCKCNIEQILIKNIVKEIDMDESTTMVTICDVCGNPTHIGECTAKCNCGCNGPCYKLVSGGTKKTKSYICNEKIINLSIYNINIEKICASKCENPKISDYDLSEKNFFKEFDEIKLRKNKIKIEIPLQDEEKINYYKKNGVNIINYEGLNLSVFKNVCYRCGKKRVKSCTMRASYCKECGELLQIIDTIDKDLTGKIAYISGGRIKIGFQVALILLRRGCFVIITTRHAHDAIERYRKEPDYLLWINNLKIYQVDFSDPVGSFKAHLDICSKYKRIDHLINNAAITLTRFRQFYRNVKRDTKDEYNNIAGIYSNYFEDSTSDAKYTPGDSSKYPDALSEDEKYPEGMHDQYEQQIQNGPNGWTTNIFEDNDRSYNNFKKIYDQFNKMSSVNSIMPILIIFLLQKCLERKEGETKSYIINVVSEEGNEFSVKTPYHVLNNILKHNLRLFTKTNAKYFYKLGICMFNVDTGWNNIQQTGAWNIDSPSDVYTGALTICYPILIGAEYYGITIKDFKEVVYRKYQYD